MTEDIEWKDVVDNLQAENEKLREQLSKIKFAMFSLESLKYNMSATLKSPYFWLGYFTALVAMLLIKVFSSLGD